MNNKENAFKYENGSNELIKVSIKFMDEWISHNYYVNELNRHEK
jgi:hypothetical protein